MTGRLRDPCFSALVERLFAEAEQDVEAERALPVALTFDNAADQQLADALAHVYMPIYRDGGRLLYSLVRAIRPATVVEFGMSMGISTLFLAAAVADDGSGRVVTTELSTRKVEQATAHLAEADLADVVEVRAGDARQTLTDVTGPIGLVLLDGWKPLCLPVLRLLEPQLTSGAIVVGDDNTFDSMEDYLAYVRNPANGYATVDFPVEDGMEISCRL
jgi:predicted O-methyltransferase YrrM